MASCTLLGAVGEVLAVRRGAGVGFFLRVLMEARVVLAWSSAGVFQVRVVLVGSTAVSSLAIEP